MNYEEVKKEITRLENEHYKEVKGYTEKYENAQKRESEALKAADKAYIKTDSEAYHKAQEEARLSHDAMQMYAAKLEELKKQPMITKEQFEEYCAVIMEHLSGIVAEDLERVREIIMDLLEIKGHESAKLTEGNMFMESMQKNLLKDPCGVLLDNGTFVPMPNQVKKFKDFSVVSFLAFISQHPLVSDLAMKEEPAKYWGKD